MGKKKVEVEIIEPTDCVCLTVKLVPWEAKRITDGKHSIKFSLDTRTKLTTLAGLAHKVELKCGTCKRIELYMNPPIEGNPIPDEWIFSGKKVLHDIDIQGGKKTENIKQTVYFDFIPGSANDDPLMLTEPSLFSLEYSTKVNFDDYANLFENSEDESQATRLTPAQSGVHTIPTDGVE